ncbi:hypothetical protein CK203_038846 [Vitis vinifera]|uniref:Retrotransposon gag domain-containing protein n=1 Tax=Vitis vinifera TaxID=29760 RepID=A0A438I1R8_VITVI|nr:hypothetical protein CK203_038846 [Vitis vinifera]
MRDRMHPPRMSAPSCIVPPTEQLVIRPHIVPLLPTFHGMESENPYAHIKEFEERYMEAINACPHHGFDTWLLVSYFYDVSRGWDEPNAREVGRMKSQPNASNAKAGMYTLNEDIDTKAKVAAMARRLEDCERNVWGSSNIIGLLNNNASYGNTYNSNWRNHSNFSWKPRASQYTQPGQAPPQASNLEQAIVNLSKVVGDFVGDQKSINAQLSQRIDSVDKRMDGMQNDLSQKIDNLQYSISRLTNLNTVQEKGNFPSQPHQNPKGIHEVEAQEGESSQVREVKAVITLRSGKEVDLLTSKSEHEAKSEAEKEKREKIKEKRKWNSAKNENLESTMNEEPERTIN